MQAIRTENVTDVKVWQVKNGSVCGVNCPWMATVNGNTLGEFRPARCQPDPAVFATRRSARQAVARITQVKVYPDICSCNTRSYSVAC